MLVNIVAWNGVATWSWDVPPEEVCGICRVSFDATCSNCKFPGDECPLVIGECTHRFHMHCIVKWLETETAKNLCPMCRRSFKAVKYNGKPTESAASTTHIASSSVGSSSAIAAEPIGY